MPKSRARKFADLLDSSGAIKATALGNAASTPTDISDQPNNSTGYFQVPQGTSAQRPESPDAGMIRFNETTGYNEIYGGGGWVTISQPPQIDSVTPSSFNGEAGATITINGSGFDLGSEVAFIDAQGNSTTSASVTFVSSGQLTATIPVNYTVDQEPLSVKVTAGNGLANTSDGVIDCGGAPTWSTAHNALLGTVGRFQNGSFSVSATDPDGQAVTYAYESGSLPPGFSVSSNGTISGNYSTSLNDNSTSTYTFVVRATDSVGNSSTRTVRINGTNSPVVQVYSYSGAEEALDVSALSSVTAYVWGAGGGGVGGAGGYAQANINTSSINTLKIVVGQAGLTGSNNGPTRSGGGGFTGIFNGTVQHASAILMAGSGGGGLSGENGGGGGGANQSGTIGTYGPSVHSGRRGQPGTVSGGGAAGTGYRNTAQSGSALRGGDGINPNSGGNAWPNGGAWGHNDGDPGCGGGAGYYGGGGSDANTSAGGGSGFANTGFCSNIVGYTGGTDGVAEASGVSYYQSGTGGRGQNGAIVIVY
jgi:hypothetical protein